MCSQATAPVASDVAWGAGPLIRNGYQIKAEVDDRGMLTAWAALDLQNDRELAKELLSLQDLWIWCGEQKHARTR